MLDAVRRVSISRRSPSAVQLQVPIKDKDKDVGRRAVAYLPSILPFIRLNLTAALRIERTSYVDTATVN